MQLILEINLKDSLSLPLAHHHIIQSMIYSHIYNSDDYFDLHDAGVLFGQREYKLFTFGPLQGHYVIKDKRIIFDQSVNLEIRSCDETLIENIAKSIYENGVRFGNEIYTDINISLMNNHIVADDLVIKMVSPVCAHETLPKGFSHFFTPDDVTFYRYIESNFTRKYIACGGEEGADITFSKIEVSPKDKYITRYKGTIIEAYKGLYRLKGNPYYLDFLYQVGLGEKNSQGFGMFEVVEE